LKKDARERGKASIRKYLAQYDEGDIVSIVINPTYQQIPHPRFQGKTGRVVGKQGRAYFVEIRDGGKTKRILATPQHLKQTK